jgi:hypothetical protein
MSKLYVHENHPHMPVAVRVEDVHEAHKARGGLNAKVAIGLTRGVATMWCAYLFAALAVVGLLGLLGWLDPFIFLLATWISQQFLQLVLLSVIMVGQGLLGKHQEMVSEETARTTQKSYHQLGQVVKHLNAQDEELLKIGARSSEIKEIRITQMQHESLFASLKSDVDKLSQAVEMLDRRLQQLQKKASGV